MTSSLQDLFNVSDVLAKNLNIQHKLAVPKLKKNHFKCGYWGD